MTEVNKPVVDDCIVMSHDVLMCASVSNGQQHKVSIYLWFLFKAVINFSFIFLPVIFVCGLSAGTAVIVTHFFYRLAMLLSVCVNERLEESFLKLNCARFLIFICSIVNILYMSLFKLH